MLMKKQEPYLLQYPELNINLTCRIIPASRRSISIRITPQKEILVRVPGWISYRQLDALLCEKKDWILKTWQSIPDPPVLTVREQNQIAALEKRYRRAAHEYIPARVAYFQQFTGGSYDKITIRDQKTRWGSCSSNGTLSFNYRLMLAPPKILDYVVVHELCHLKHMNHSPAFWHAVEDVLPDYRERKQWLKEHGSELTFQRKQST